MDNQKKVKNTENNEINSKKNRKKSIRRLFLAALGLIGVSVASVAYAWFFYKRQIDTFAWIKTPIFLEIGSGNNHSIVHLDMGSIDAENSNNEALYVFCVYGEPIDLYSLQLAYTTNIAFYYDIYRADYVPNGQDSNVTFTYTDDGGEKTEYFKYNPESTPVISAKPLNKMELNVVKAHQSHRLSYGDEKGENPVGTDKVQSNAEPLYWLASENGVSVLNPRNIGMTQAGNGYFCDYFVIRVHWDEGTVINDKETDMVYLTASR